MLILLNIINILKRIILKKTNEIKKHKYICEKCNKEFYTANKIHKDRHIHCDECKQNRPKYKKIINTIYDVSSRTMSLILQRANIGCAICGWNETSGDIHHIIERKNNGTNELNNLIYVCPNCHRIIHKTNKYSIEYLQTKSLDKILPNWKDYYNI